MAMKGIELGNLQSVWAYYLNGKMRLETNPNCKGIAIKIQKIKIVYSKRKTLNF